MLKEDKSVKHVLKIGGEEVEQIESGYHLSQVAAIFAELREKYKDQCQKQLDKYFGPETEYGKLVAELKAVSKKPEQEQTDEDKAKALELENLYDRVYRDYASDPDTPTVSSTRHRKEGDQMIFSGNLNDLAKAANGAIMNRKTAVETLTYTLYDIMHRSGVKLATLILGFDGDEQDESLKDNHAILVFGSSFRDTNEQDLAVLDGSLLEIHDQVVPKMRSELGIKEEPEIIQGGRWA